MQRGHQSFRSAIDLINFGLSPTTATSNSTIDHRSLSANIRQVGFRHARFNSTQFLPSLNRRQSQRTVYLI
jgi:hypothetical protein